MHEGKALLLALVLVGSIYLLVGMVYLLARRQAKRQGAVRR